MRGLLMLALIGFAAGFVTESAITTSEFYSGLFLGVAICLFVGSLVAARWDSQPRPMRRNVWGAPGLRSTRQEVGR